MVNHFRTLFLNQPAQPEVFSSQYVDPSFAPIALTAEESAIRNHILNAQYVPEFKNYLATLMTRLVYLNPYSFLLKELDSRLTFDLETNLQASLQDTIVLDQQNAATTLKVIGNFLPTIDRGIFSGQWQLQYQDAGTVLITDLRSATQRAVSVAFSGGGTGLYSVDGRSPLYFQFVNASAVPSGLLATVTASVPMSYDVVAALDKLRADGRVYPIFDNVMFGSELNSIFSGANRQDFAISAALIAYILSVSSRL